MLGSLRPECLRVSLLVILAAAFLAACSPSKSTHAPAAAITGGSQFGAPPVTEAEPVDIYAKFHLPGLHDAPSGGLAVSLGKIHLLERARTLGLSSQSGIKAWRAIDEEARTSLAEMPAQGVAEVSFRGNRASELNQMLSRSDVQGVRVDSRSITVDEPIAVSRSGLRLNLSGATVEGANSFPYALRIEGAHDVQLTGGTFHGGDSAVLVNHAQNVRISKITIQGIGGAGIVITESRGVTVRGSSISGLKFASITLGKGTTGSVVEHNRIENNLGSSNWAGGVLLTDREVDLAANAVNMYGPGVYGGVPQDLARRTHPPSGNLIRSNELLRNQANGIYSDGGIRNAIVSNLIAGNAKEGICLDNGSTSNVIAGNVVRRNGARWGEPDTILQLEMIGESGRMADGTPTAKVPGISLDNALYNVVFDNNVVENYGGGIKLVRSAIFNVIGLNTVRDDALGDSPRYHFFGIELGSAPGDPTTGGLDIVPSRGNLVFSNVIRGTHYAGVFFANGSDENDVFDNTVMDATHWALESVRPMANRTLNNLTNMPSRNIGPGVDPNLFVYGRAVMDEDLSARK